MITLGYDIGSSFIKASALDTGTGKILATAVSPDRELEIESPTAGWAEQHPDVWWQHFKKVTQALLSYPDIENTAIKAIGISYQMHGLVTVDKHMKPLRPSIIWCDSRATSFGEKALNDLGPRKTMNALINFPGNFTASKLKWVKENEPNTFGKISKFMLPGDYIALKLTGHATTTPSGLSEGILWDYEKERPADFLLDYYELDSSMIPEIVPNFSRGLKISTKTAAALDLPQDTVISYRAGDQPNNAFSLNVLQPGEVAATAGTSGVVYGVSDTKMTDDKSRINTFLHVNHTSQSPRYGVLMCLNGTGILYSWLRHQLASGMSYEQLNEKAGKISPGAEGVMVFPFGNGAERILGNQHPGASFHHIDFNRHTLGHIVRAAQEGIVFSLQYGMEIMQSGGTRIKTIRVGKGNMFLSPVFRETLASLTGASIEMYDTDGAAGAARGAAVGASIYQSIEEAFHTLEKQNTVFPDKKSQSIVKEAYQKWKYMLNQYINQ